MLIEIWQENNYTAMIHEHYHGLLIMDPSLCPLNVYSMSNKNLYILLLPGLLNYTFYSSWIYGVIPKCLQVIFLCYLRYFMSCCIKYHDIAVQYDEKYNFLILLVVLCYLLVVLYYLKYFTSCCIKYHDEKSNFLILLKIFHELLY